MCVQTEEGKCRSCEMMTIVLVRERSNRDLGRRGQPNEVQFADRRSRRFQLRPDVGIVLRGGARPVEHRDPAQKVRDGRRQRARRGLCLHAVEQFGLRHHGQAQLPAIQLAEPRSHRLRTLANDVARYVRVEHIALHRNSLRFCGSRSLRLPRKPCAPSGFASKKSSQDDGLAESTTLSPTLETNTSSAPSKRYFAGRRTAWLRPVRNSLAVAGRSMSGLSENDAAF